MAVLGAAAASALQRGDLETSGRYARLATVEGIPDSCPSGARAQAAGSLALVTSVTDTPEGIRLLRVAIRNLEAIEDAWGALNLGLVAVILSAVVGDIETAQREIATLLPRARQLANPTNLIVALYVYAQTWYSENPREALTALDEGFALTEQGASDVVLESTHGLRAQIQHSLGDQRGALTSLLSAIEVADRNGNRQEAIAFLLSVTEVFSTRHAYDLAAVAIGVTNQGPLAALVLYGRESESHAQTHDAVLTALGEPRFRQLVDQGATMTYEEAITWARGSLGTQIAHAARDAG